MSSARRAALRALVPLLLAAAVAACGGGAGAGGGKRIQVYAAASLRDVVTELAARFEEETGVEPVLNFGSSGKLAVQIEQGGHADVFLSASEVEMDRLARGGHVDASTRGTLVSNQLVVVVPRGGRKLARPEELAEPWVERLSLANTESVPAGRYARAWLEDAGLWERVEPRVLPGIDVRAALAAVEYGGADAGIVYRTDAAISDEVELAWAVPPDEGPRISYPVAVLAGRERKHAHALRFLEHLRSPESRAAFERHGFLVPDAE